MNYSNRVHLYGRNLPPPSIIYQTDFENLQNIWLDEFDSKEHDCFTSSLTGWINEDLSLSWLTNVFDRAIKEKARFERKYRLLFIDEHNSHVNMKFLDWCDKHKILIAVYSSHSTHRLQPLNVSLFSSLINFYSQNVSDWMHKIQRYSNIIKRDFFELFWSAFHRAFTPKNILSEWEKIDLQPLNSARVLDQIKSIERLTFFESIFGFSALFNAD